MWDEAAASYFTASPDDPRVVLLRFEPAMGEYWTAPSSEIVLAIKFLEAKLLGERPSLRARGARRCLKSWRQPPTPGTDGEPLPDPRVE